DADRLFFDRESAQQATSERVAAWTAARYAGATLIADLGCGAGGDALALAQRAPVVAVDRDAARVAMLRANAALRGVAARIDPREGDAGSAALPAGVDAAWLDPPRR